MVAALFLMVASCVSNVLLAAAVTRPRRSAVIVATSPIPSRTTSCDSLLRCVGGNQLRMTVAARALPKVQMNVMDAMVMARTGPGKRSLIQMIRNRPDLPRTTGPKWTCHC